MGLKCAIYYSDKWQKAQVATGTLQISLFHYMNTLWLYPKHTFMMIHRLILNRASVKCKVGLLDLPDL